MCGPIYYFIHLFVSNDKLFYSFVCVGRYIISFIYMCITIYYFINLYVYNDIYFINLYVCNDILFHSFICV